MESARDIVDKIRELECGWLYELPHDEAAALIEQYAKRVPRAMLDEVWLNGYKCQQGKKDTDMAEIAAKYGVKIEED